MANIFFLFLFSYLDLISGQFLRSHDYLMDRFQNSASLSDISSVQTKWITQPVDHFNQTDVRKWQMRYFENMDKWSLGGPIFVYIGGEGELVSSVLATGILFDLASETNGAMFATEHRYYGKSQPFPNITVSNLKYLSSRQALADIANFIRTIKELTSLSESKVVIVGGSYAGNLAAWMRLLYPDLVNAAIASSAPVLAKLNFFEYLETVGDDFQKYATPECFNTITDQFKTLKELIKTESGINEIKEMFGICENSDLTKPENKAILFFSLTYQYCLTAQYASPEEIRNFCTHDFILKHYENVNCIPIDFDMFYNETTPLEPWIYQTCTEFGYFISAPNNQPFAGIPIDEDYQTKICSATLGPEYDKASIEAAVKKTNDMYGGLRPNLTNVIFVNGEIDPWHRLSVLEDLSETVPARMIPEASHCNDLFNKIKPEVTKVQEEEKRFIKKWIGFST